MRYHMMLDTASEGNFKTRTPEEVKRLIENLMSSKSSKNLDMHRIKSVAVDSDKIVEVEINFVHEVSLVEQDIEKDENQDHIQMMEKILKIQQVTSDCLNMKLDCFYKELTIKFEALDVHVMTLATQVFQIAKAVKEQTLFKRNDTVQPGIVHHSTVYAGTVHLTSIDTLHLRRSTLFFGTLFIGILFIRHYSSKN